MDGYVQAVSDMLDAIQANLLVKATKFRDEHIFGLKIMRPSRMWSRIKLGFGLVV